MRSLVLTVSLALAAPAAAQPAYDAGPLLESLRPNERARVPRQAGVAAGALPLYELDVQLADDLRSYELAETLTWTNDAGRPLSSVVLRLWINAVSPQPLVELVEGACLDDVSCSTSMPSADAIVVAPATPVPAGGRLRIQLRLRGRLQEIDPSRTTLTGQGLEGLGALSAGHGGGDYGLLAHSDGLASLAAFFPTLARMRGGVWEQSDASTLGDLGADALMNVRARIRVPDGVRVVASGIEDPPLVVGSRTEVRVRAAFVREFAFAASPRFVHRDRAVGGVTVRSWFLDGDGAAGDRALDAAAHALALFERRFGPYPWTELDVVEAPLVGGAGGVELGAMVLVANMLYRPVGAGGQGDLLGSLMGGGGAAALEQRRESMLELTTAHEVAHQWWHGIVGSDSREHPFQDEALAQYSAMLYVLERHGAARAERETRDQVTAGYHMMRLMGRADAPADQPVGAFADTLTYGGIVYGKAPHLYPALRRLVGDRAFFAALRAHVAEHRFRTAPPRALYARMARGPRAAQVNALVARWLDETHGDDDLGPPDLGRMLGGAGGDDAQSRALMQQLQRLLGGSGAGGGAGTRGILDALRTPGLDALLEQLRGGSP